MLKVVFLGTSSAVPTVERGLTSIAIKRGGEYILIDCGDGTQRQIFKAKLGMKGLKRIFITHLHGDHFLGLPAFIETMSILRRTEPLEIYGPKGIKEFIEVTSRVASFDPPFEIRITELTGETVFKFNGYKIEFFKVEHGIPECYGIKFEERDYPGKFNVQKANELGVPVSARGFLQRGFNVKLEDGRVITPKDVLGPSRLGRKIVYSSDTRPCENVVKKAKDADLLIHDATFDASLVERAIKTGHSTINEACEVALKAGVHRLVLTHFSARYKSVDLERLELEAQKIFKGAILARDLLSIELPMREV